MEKTEKAPVKQKDYFTLKSLGVVIVAWFIVTMGWQAWSIATLKPYAHPEQFEGKGSTSPVETYACQGRSGALWACTKSEAIQRRRANLPTILILSWGMPVLFAGMAPLLPWEPYRGEPTAVLINPYMFIIFWMLVILGIQKFHRKFKAQNSK